MIRKKFYFLLAAASWVTAVTLLAQSGSQQTPSDPASQLTPEQRENYNAAVQAFKAEHYADALAIFRAILPQLTPGSPTQPVVTKYTAEAAINTGDRDYALQLSKPIEAADANDWQAASMLARIYAETGQKQLRDAELARLVELHTKDASSQISKMRQIILERIPTKNGCLLVLYSLEPWGPYKVYVLGRVLDSSGQQVLRITLESSDFDQPLFNKEHPDLAAKGMRRFSLDGYGPDQNLPNGQVTQSHYTFGFYDGRPQYDAVRERMIQVAEGKAKTMSATDHPSK